MEGTIGSITLLALSSVVIIILSKRLLGFWVNPVSFFVVMGLFHNWIGSVIELFTKLEWREESTEWARQHVLIINLVGLWAFLLGALLTRRAGKRTLESGDPLITRLPPAALFELGYFLLTAIAFLLSILMARGGVAQAYGAEQSAFAPTSSNIFRLFLLREPFLLIGYATRSLTGRSRPLIYGIAVGLEILLAAVSGGRKLLFMVLIGMGLIYVATHRIRVQTLLRTGIMVALVGFLSIAIGIWRMGFRLPVEQRTEFFQQQLGGAKFGEHVTKALMSANSQGVQSWMYALWYPPGAWLDPMYGKTYLQALVNTFVPRQFQGELVSWQAAYVFKDKAYRGVTTMGYDFAFTAEAMLNFGPYFAFVPFVLLGAFSTWLFSKWRHTGSVPYAAAYFAEMGILSIVLRTDAVSMFRFFSLTFIPLIVFTQLMGLLTPVTALLAYRRDPKSWKHLFAPPPPRRPAARIVPQAPPPAAAPATR